MTAAIMQPYLFPYLGYYALAAAGDVFVLYGDAQYRRRGYVNRNRLLLANGEPTWFTVPVVRGRREDPIDARLIDPERYQTWRARLFRSLEHAYRRAPYYDPTVELLDRVLDGGHADIGALASASVVATLDHLGVEVRPEQSRDLAYDRQADAQTKIIGMCTALGANTYVNPPGGRDLYDGRAFAKTGLQLAFLDFELEPYPQSARPDRDFAAGLSVLDALFNLPRETVTRMLRRHTLDYAN